MSLPGDTIALHFGHLRSISSNNRPQFAQNFESSSYGAPQAGHTFSDAAGYGTDTGGTGGVCGTAVSSGFSGAGTNDAGSSYLFPHSTQKQASSSRTAPQNEHILPAGALSVPDISAVVDAGAAASSLAPHSMQNKLSSVMDAPQFVQ